jgi:hypothetical protein
MNSNTLKTIMNCSHEECPVAVAAIDLNDCRFQVREQLDKDALARYQDIIAARGMEGFDCKPILWEIPGTKKVAILDGFHRIQAAVNVGRAEVPAITLTGMSQADATLLAIQANLANGVQLKAEERMEACRRIIEALTEKKDVNSNTHVAELMGVSEGTIRMYREKLIAAGQLAPAAKVLGKDGKQQAAKKKPACRPSAKTSAPATKPVAVCETIKASIQTAGSSDNAQTDAPPKFPRIADDPDSPGYAAGVRRQNQLIQTLNAASLALSNLAQDKWANVFDESGTEEAAKELVEHAKRALDARPKTPGSQAA